MNYKFTIEEISLLVLSIDSRINELSSKLGDLNDNQGKVSIIYDKELESLLLLKNKIVDMQSNNN